MGMTVNKSRDNGFSWEEYGTGLNSKITDIAIDEVNKILYTGTETGGVLKLDLGNSTFIDTEENTLKKDFKLYSNFPNPFNQCTMISYQLSVISRVRLEIFNTIGQLVRVIMDEEKQAGEYRVLWDGKDMKGKDVPSGVYLYRLTAVDFTEIKKMTLVR